MCGQEKHSNPKSLSIAELICVGWVGPQGRNPPGDPDRWVTRSLVEGPVLSLVEGARPSRGAPPPT
ncbi:geranylgeranyl reductase [Methylocaldum marinum]|uniref:Geranylgeranyl reductase n=1 Tax=Methylocaldum marinum TaxID=1432792 RepID=A0A250KTG5_9GAMM|nr:geranylgeranyl reductase [Methylocaldum marinum]